MSRFVYVKFITRELVRQHPEARFVFGDNLIRAGLGGQAGAMRGEPNAIGVATKRRPSMGLNDFFSDSEPSDRIALARDLEAVDAAITEGWTIYVPLDGLGTGLSELPTRAPGLHSYLIQWFRDRDQECPWPLP